MYDKVYCINLDRRPDRFAEFNRNVIDGLGIDKNIFERISAIDTSSKNMSGAIGCNLSHLKIWKDMIDNGYESALVFEDDFEPVVSREVFDSTVSKLYRDHPNFTVCCISWYGRSETVFLPRDDTFSFGNNIVTTAGYIISLEYAKAMYGAVSEGVINMMHGEDVSINIIDVIWWKFQNHQWLLTTGVLGIQSPNFSDIQQQHMDVTNLFPI